MKISSRISRTLLLLTAFLYLFSTQASAQSADDHQYTSESIQTGLAVYVRVCQLCHGPQGDLVDGINLRTGQFRNAQSDADLINVMITGLDNGRMPAFDILREEELEGVVAYIRAGFDPDAEAVIVGDPVRGKALFEGEGRCIDCHRVNGVGPRTAPDLSNIGAIRTPLSLQQNLVDPASVLLAINRPIRIVTLNEETITGRRLNEDSFTVQVIDSEERLRSIRKSDIATYQISDQPSKQPTSLSSDQVADLVGYLLTLRGQ